MSDNDSVQPSVTPASGPLTSTSESTTNAGVASETLVVSQLSAVFQLPPLNWRITRDSSSKRYIFSMTSETYNGTSFQKCCRVSCHCLSWIRMQWWGRVQLLNLRDPNNSTNQRNHYELMSRVRAESATVSPIEGETHTNRKKRKHCEHARQSYHFADCAGGGVCFPNPSDLTSHVSALPSIFSPMFLPISVLLLVLVHVPTCWLERTTHSPVS